MYNKCRNISIRLRNNKVDYQKVKKKVVSTTTKL